MKECIASIRVFSGPTSKRQLTESVEDIRITLSPASRQTAAFYENVPLGQLYELMVTDSQVDHVPDGAEIAITDGQDSGIETDSVFIVIAKSQKQNIGGRTIITGACYIKE